jgi:hypothetical protein
LDVERGEWGKERNGMGPGGDAKSETERKRWTERGEGGEERREGGCHLDLADDDMPQADEVYEERRSDFLSTDTDDTDDADDADGDRNAELSNANKSFADHRVTGSAPHQPPAQSGDAAAGTDGVGQVIRAAERATEVHSTGRGGFAGHYHTVPSACRPKLRILIHTARDIAR